MPGWGGRQEQAGIGHQAMVVKEDADTVGFVLWQHLLGAPCFRAGFSSKTIIPDSEEHPLASSRAVPKDVLRWIRVKLLKRVLRPLEVGPDVGYSALERKVREEVVLTVRDSPTCASFRRRFSERGSVRHSRQGEVVGPVALRPNGNDVRGGTAPLKALSMAHSLPLLPLPLRAAGSVLQQVTQLGEPVTDPVRLVE